MEMQLLVVNKQKNYLYLSLIFKQVMKKLIKKGEIIQRPDDKILKAFFIKKGLLNSYIIDNKGKKLQHN